MMSKTQAVLLSGVLILVGCVNPVHQINPNPEPNRSETKSAAKPRLTELEAIRLAKAEAEREGLQLNEYDEPTARYDGTRKDPNWFVFFKGKAPRFGHHFGVFVNDESKATRLFRGR